ncbi:hypothetical protein NLA06_04670 [Desulfomicrobium sp. ZS1]|uniref:hypothetical protein n=1 Tax=Desulfomicrobium sp. ZS1 TaxID=2952228 RepID=UPI0020B304FA|nr:hypothetical protein [Desulfomicrobium sp. ZS1]UTF51189.1 hypothetical protein NLA06_04670 [Desulfomicrobium sp. ZS1]
MNKTLVKNIDDGLAAFSLFEKALRVIVPNPSAREILGLKCISEKLYEPLGWYIWLEESQGVYALELLDAATKKGRFVIRFFPFTDGKLFNCLSEDEQRVRKSKVFDFTGTPDQCSGLNFASELFVVGVLSLVWHGNVENGLEISLESIPGWARYVSWKLYDVLINSLCHYYGISAKNGNVSDDCKNNPWRVHYVFTKCIDKEQEICNVHLSSLYSNLYPWLNPIWWSPKNLNICNLNVDYPE